MKKLINALYELLPFIFMGLMFFIVIFMENRTVEGMILFCICTICVLAFGVSHTLNDIRREKTRYYKALRRMYTEDWSAEEEEEFGEDIDSFLKAKEEERDEFAEN